MSYDVHILGVRRLNVRFLYSDRKDYVATIYLFSVQHKKFYATYSYLCIKGA